jgi:hypothetical protein
MKQQELNGKAGSPTEAQVLWKSEQTPAWEGSVVYREMADFPVQLIDPVEELSRSVAELEDLQARLRFMMREIRAMMKA